VSAVPPPIPASPRAVVHGASPRIHAGAVAIGVAVAFAGAIAVGTVATMALSMRAAFSGARPDGVQSAITEGLRGDTLLKVFFTTGTLFTVIGAFVTARIARQRILLHAVLMGGGCIVLGQLIELVSRAATPPWYRAAGVAATVPAAMLGGALSRAARRTPT
jgi:hypothetical protein